ncbi:hypothetical protein AYK25_08400 [Thermoplasmatales archaeon SM1-50]|nr:MAG: hypothetical protein AYK25_08400 [Thermoplasmatales archaeon SM1-50]
MHRNTIILSVAVIVFIAGFILCVFSLWWWFGLAGISADEHFVWDTYRRGVVATGAWLLVGLALISIAMIVTLLVKTSK